MRSRTFGSLLNTRETVFMETPAVRATSSILAGISGFLEPGYDRLIALSSYNKPCCCRCGLRRKTVRANVIDQRAVVRQVGGRACAERADHHEFARRGIAARERTAHVFQVGFEFHAV